MIHVCVYMYIYIHIYVTKIIKNKKIRRNNKKRGTGLTLLNCTKEFVEIKENKNTDQYQYYIW